MANETTVKDVEAFLAKVPEPHRTTLQKLRATIRAAAPKAEEFISYGIPAFKQEGGLVCYAAFKDHCSLFPMSDGVIKGMAADIKGYEVAKGTIRFPKDEPLPAGLVKRIVKLRIAENAQIAAARATKKAAKKAPRKAAKKAAKKPAKKK